MQRRFSPELFSKLKSGSHVTLFVLGSTPIKITILSHLMRNDGAMQLNTKEGITLVEVSDCFQHNGKDTYIDVDEHGHVYED